MPSAPFADRPPTPAAQFKLYWYAAVLRVIEQVAEAFEAWEQAFERFPFLAGYNNELAQRGLDGVAARDAAAWWRDAVLAWEQNAAGHLPWRALRHGADLEYEALTLLASIG